MGNLGQDRGSPTIVPSSEKTNAFFSSIILRKIFKISLSPITVSAGPSRLIHQRLLLSPWIVYFAGVYKFVLHRPTNTGSILYQISLCPDSSTKTPTLDSTQMFGTVIRYAAKASKPKVKPIELKTPPEQTQTITRVLFDIVKEHGPLTVAETWEHVKEVGLKDLRCKRHMKIVLRWMRERQKVRLICNHVGAHKQFLYTSWFSKPTSVQAKALNIPSKPKS